MYLFGPRYEILSVPHRTAPINAIWISLIFLNLLRFCHVCNIVTDNISEYIDILSLKPLLHLSEECSNKCSLDPQSISDVHHVKSRATTMKLFNFVIVALIVKHPYQTALREICIKKGNHSCQ